MSEGLPGYFGVHGRAGVVQPNYGFEVYGEKESDVGFMPDISDDSTFAVNSGGI